MINKDKNCLSVLEPLIPPVFLPVTELFEVFMLGTIHSDALRKSKEYFGSNVLCSSPSFLFHSTDKVLIWTENSIYFVCIKKKYRSLVPELLFFFFKDTVHEELGKTVESPYKM